MHPVIWEWNRTEIELERIHKVWYDLAEAQPNQKKDPTAWAMWDRQMDLLVRQPSIALGERRYTLASKLKKLLFGSST